MYQTSARVHVIILITWILIDTRRSKNIQNNVKFVCLLELSIGQINKILKKRNVYKWKKLSNLLTGFICWKHTHMQILYKPVV